MQHETLEQLSARIGVSMATLKQRVRLGRKIDAPLRKPLEVNGMASHEFSLSIGVSRKLTTQRIRRGWAEVALIKPSRPREKNTDIYPEEFKGKSLKQLSKETGINYATLRSRWKKGRIGLQLIAPPDSKYVWFLEPTKDTYE
jgi:lambda repressor-like predicted transcriptional regulator